MEAAGLKSYGRSCKLSSSIKAGRSKLQHVAVWCRIKDLKKVYMAVAGHDTLRDDGVLMKTMLDDAR